MNLDAAIERLYAVFTDHPLDPPVAGCDCCVAPADVAALDAAPLRTLDRELLGRYAESAVTLWGTEEQFKHLFPRVFEAYAREDLPVARLRNLAAYVADDAPTGHAKPGRLHLRNAFWPAEPERRVIAWLASPELARALEHAVFEHYERTSWVDELATCYDHLSWLAAIATA